MESKTSDEVQPDNQLNTPPIGVDTMIQAFSSNISVLFRNQFSCPNRRNYNHPGVNKICSILKK